MHSSFNYAAADFPAKPQRPVSHHASDILHYSNQWIPRAETFTIHKPRLRQFTPTLLLTGSKVVQPLCAKTHSRIPMLPPPIQINSICDQIVSTLAVPENSNMCPSASLIDSELFHWKVLCLIGDDACAQTANRVKTCFCKSIGNGDVTLFDRSSLSAGTWDWHVVFFNAVFCFVCWRCAAERVNVLILKKSTEDEPGWTKRWVRCQQITSKPKPNPVYFFPWCRDKDGQRLSSAKRDRWREAR